MISDKNIRILEKYITSMGKGVFEDVKITIDSYNWIEIGIYIDWTVFPKNHGVYKINNLFVEKINNSVKSYFNLIGVNSYSYMISSPVIVNNFNEKRDEQTINEVERDWRDREYGEQYSKIGKKFIEVLSQMIETYSEDDKTINLYDKNNKRLLSFYKKNNELYFNRDINEYVVNLIPAFIWARHGKYVISDMFEEFFPNFKVRDVISAGMN